MMKKLLPFMLAILPMAASARGTSTNNSQITAGVQALSTLTLPHWQATEDDIEDQKTELRAQLMNIVASLNNCKGQLAPYENSELSSSLDLLQSVAAELSTSINAATTADDIAECQGSIASLKVQTDELQYNIMTFIQDFNAQKVSLRIHLSMIDQQIEALENNLEEVEAPELYQRLNALKDSETAIAEAIEAANSYDKITACMSSIASLASDVETLNSDVNTFIQNINTQKEQLRIALGALDSQVNALSSSLQNNATESEAPELYSRLSSLQTQLSVMSSAIEEANSYEKIATCQSNIASLNSQIEGLQDDIETFIEQKQQVEEDKVALRTRLNNVQSALSNIETALSPYDSQTHYEILGNLRSEVDYLSYLIEEATTPDDIAECKSRLSTLESNCAALQESVQELINEITEARNEMHDEIIMLQIKLDQIESQLQEKAPNYDDAPSLHGRLSALRSDASNMGPQIDEANSQVAIQTCQDIIDNMWNEADALAEDVSSFEPSVNEGFCPDTHHPHLIDLGLPSGTMWACCNVEASSPSKPGGYYAWGETFDSSYRDWADGYTHCDGSAETCVDIGNDIAGTDYDVAHVKWGGNWRMPNIEQIEELISNENITAQWTTVNGQNGTLFTSSVTGNSIFLPAAGYGWYRTLDVGEYSSSTVNTVNGITYNTLYFDPARLENEYPLAAISNTERFHSSSVRPVVKLTEDSFIDFVDPTVKEVCVSKWDTNSDGELSYREASVVTELSTGPLLSWTPSEFGWNPFTITSFDELRYFTAVTTINSLTFYNWSDMTSISFPSSLTTIEDLAFQNCSSIESVSIPASVTNLSANGSNPFLGCHNLISIVVDEDNTVYDSRNNCNAIIETANNALVSACANTQIPNDITTIYHNAFKECSVTGIYVPASVTQIQKYDDDGNPFEGCSNLEYIAVDEANAVYDSRNGCNAIIETSTNTLIAGCMNTVIDPTVTAIGSDAFFCHIWLANITIPNSVTSIGANAFSGCDNLVTVTAEMAEPPAIAQNTFTNRANATLYVPVGSKAAYEAADYWKEFKRIAIIGYESSDVNMDGKTDITDVSVLVNVILNKSNISENADVNGDGKVDINDVTKLVNIILKKDTQ